MHPVSAKFSPFDSLTRPEPTPVDERLVDAVPTLKGTAVAFQVPNGLGIHTKLRWIDADAFSDGGKNFPPTSPSKSRATTIPRKTCPDAVRHRPRHCLREVDSVTGLPIFACRPHPNGITGLPGLVSDEKVTQTSPTSLSWLRLVRRRSTRTTTASS